MKKICKECRQVKPSDQFSGKNVLCKPCYNEWRKLWRLEKEAKLSETNLIGGY